MNAEIQALLPVMQRGVKRVIATCAPPMPKESAPEKEGKSHSHQTREIFFQLQGETNYMLDGKWYHIKEGDALFIESYQEHGLYFRHCERNLKQFWIGRYPKRLNIVLISLDAAGELHHELCYCSGINSVYQTLLNNWDAVRNGEIADPAWQKRVLSVSLDLLLCDIVRCAADRGSFQSRKRRENVIHFVSDYIDGNHGSDCALDRLEKLTGYSRYYLSHLYRDFYGKTIGEAINEARMRYFLAQDWHVNAKEIAGMLGFTSPAIFWKWHRNNRDLENTLRRELHLADGKKNGK